MVAFTQKILQVISYSWTVEKVCAFEPQYVSDWLRAILFREQVAIPGSVPLAILNGNKGTGYNSRSLSLLLSNVPRVFSAKLMFIFILLNSEFKKRTDKIN